MKLTLLLTLVLALQVTAKVNSQRTTFIYSGKDVTLEDVFSYIETNSEFRFFYPNEYIDLKQYVSVNVENVTIDELLQTALKNQNLVYRIFDGNLVVIKEEQPNMIKGKITDINGNPLPGVNILEKGTTNGAVTDLDGNYNISVSSPNAILSFSYIGFLTEEIELSGQITVDVTLIEDILALDEVVVVGYGTQKKLNLTGSVVKVDADELAKQTVTSAAQAIQGRVSGVEVIRNSGAPGAGATIRVRGLGTFGNSTPLVLIDGIEGDINLISPQDIESINILKDASACAIYGTRAANGVIIVTTKTGQSGTSKINYNYSVGMSNAIRIPGRLNAKEFVLMQNEAHINANVAPFYTDEEMASFGEGTDWVDAVLQTGIRQNHSLQFLGGTEKLRYSLMADLLDETGSVINSWYKRYNVRLNLDADVTDWIRIGLNSFASHSKQHETPYQGYENPLVVYALQYSPTISPKVGGMEGTGGPNHDAPNEAEWWGMDPVTYSDFYAKNRNYNPKYTLTSSFFAEFKLMDGLNFKTTWGVNKYFANNKVFYPSYTYYDSLGKEDGGSVVSERLPNDRQLTQSAYDNYSYTITNLLTYTKTLNDVHNLSFIAGHNEQLYKNRNFSATAYNFPTNELQMLGLGTERQSVNERSTHWSLRSYFGRLNYDYQGRYLAEFSVRRDASSKFAEKYRWGTFPSGSVGWRISDENFMKQFGWLDDMKLRASYGVLGGQDIGEISWNSSEMVRTGFDIGNQLNTTGLYESYSTMDLSNAYPFNHTYITGAASTSYANPNIKWEVAHITNIGLDMTVLNGSIVLNAEYFNKKTSDLILPVNLPGSLGILTGSDLPTSFQNVGEMKNTGFEYIVHYFKNKGDFNFDIRYTGSHFKNEIVKLQEGVDNYFLDANYAHQHKVGEPYGAISGFNVIGIYQTQEEIDARLATITERGDVQPGDYIYDDTNGDGIIDGEDVIVQGSPLPSYVFGLTANASYKGFDFNIHFQGDIGKKVVAAVRGRFNFSYYMYLNNYDYVLDRWRGPGTSDSQLAHVTAGGSVNGLTNTQIIQNASYGKIRHVELGYTMPANISRKIGMEKLRLFCNVANLAYFTEYQGFEVERTGSYQRTDITPQSRTTSFGVNIQF